MLSDLRRRKFTLYFQALDENRNGVLELRDVRALVDNLAAIRGISRGSPAHTSLAQGYLRVFSTNSRLNLEEFLDVCDALMHPSPALDEAMVESSDILFDIIDADGDGRLNLDEYTSFLRAHHLPEDGAAATFRRLDLDGDGYVTRAEYHALARDFFFGEDPGATGNWLWGQF
jgi:Ca2+-binding EF-hand superfamily protein